MASAKLGPGKGKGFTGDPVAPVKSLPLSLASESESESEEDESEDDGAALTTALERQIKDTISALRAKDPRIYNKDVAFFEGGAAGAPAPAAAQPASKPKAGKKAADVIRAQLLSAAAEGRTDAFDEDEGEAAGKRLVDDGDRGIGHRMYDAEQAALRAEFLSTVSGQKDLLKPAKAASRRKAQAEEEEDGEALLRVVSKPDEAAEGGEVVARETLKRMLKRRDGAVAEHAAEIRDPDAFLDAFVASRAWKDDVAAAEESAEEEDAEALDEADRFEATYNFRYEEPGSGAIVGHAREVEGSMRRKEPKRKESRDRRKARQEEERAEAEAASRKAMAAKRAELTKASGKGLNEAVLAKLLDADMDADFDPEAHDAMMAKLFGDEYYGEEDEEEFKTKLGGGAGGAGVEEAEDEPMEDADEEGVDEEEEEADAGGRRSRKSKKRHEKEKKASKRLSHAAALKTALTADAQAVRSGSRVPLVAGLEEDDTDDVLVLGFEDVIADGLKTRFKYTQVPPQDYGLEDEELLLADDADLNAYISLKKIAPYREVEWVVPARRRKESLAMIRAKVSSTVASLGLDKPNVAGTNAATGATAGWVQPEAMSKKARKRAAAAAAAAAAAESGALAVEPVTGGGVQEGGSRGKKRKRSHKGGRAGGEAAAEVEAPAMVHEAPPSAADGDGGRKEKKERKEKSKKKEKSEEKEKSEKEDGSRLVKVASGAVIKASRLASYGGGAKA